MEVIQGQDFQIKNSAVSLGKFDGLHEGHRLLLKEIKKDRRLNSTVFTFAGISRGPQIYTGEEKQFLLEQLGIKREVIFPFCEETRAMTADEFVQKILLEQMDAKLICVGEDFRFGRDRGGDVRLLAKYAGKNGVRLCVFAKKRQDEQIISSTRIRTELATGHIEVANRLLGTPYFVIGEVVHGNALGRTIGMPTANIIPGEEKLLPEFGVYATRVTVDEDVYFGVTNVGVKPTVGAKRAMVETTLLDFQGDLYGKRMRVEFLYFLRMEQRFDNLGALREQMGRDRKRAQALCKIMR